MYTHLQLRGSDRPPVTLSTLGRMKADGQKIGPFRRLLACLGLGPRDRLRGAEGFVGILHQVLERAVRLKRFGNVGEVQRLDPNPPGPVVRGIPKIVRKDLAILLGLVQELSARLTR